MASVLDSRIGLGENIKLEAFDDDWSSIGVFESISQAARKLFIKNRSTIQIYLNGGKGMYFTGKRKGVTSYKTGKRYHFKIVKNE